MIEPANGLSVTEVQSMIDQATDDSNVVFSMNATPSNGATVTIPDSAARVVNLLLWPATNLSQVTVVLPPTMLGRRVFLYTDKAISEVDVISTQSGVSVRNGTVSMNDYDQTVFNTASLTIWARVATS